MLDTLPSHFVPEVPNLEHGKNKVCALLDTSQKQREQKRYPIRAIVVSTVMPANHESQQTSEPDRLEAATDEAIAACGGDARDAVKALIVANEFLEAQVEELRADVSKGYARGYHHERFKTYTG
jgi:hypothetical protein